MLAEQTDEWTEARRYMGPELLNRARLNSIDTTEPASNNDSTTMPIAA